MAAADSSLFWVVARGGVTHRLYLVHENAAKSFADRNALGAALVFEFSSYLMGRPLMK